MKIFNDHHLSIEKCIYELAEFQKLLLSKEELKEREDILPFLRKNLHFASFIGTCFPNIGSDLDVVVKAQCRNVESRNKTLHLKT
jgi:hypothetical protein